MEWYINMNFSRALELIKQGERLSRTWWNDKDKFVFLVAGSQFKVNREPLINIYPEGTLINYAPHIDVQYADGSISVWQPSMNDLMAEDWEVYAQP